MFLLINFYHSFAISDTVFRAMQDENRDHCILISGESGSGKTEASKYILRHLSACSNTTSSGESQVINQQLIQSNPILEVRSFFLMQNPSYYFQKLKYSFETLNLVIENLTSYLEYQESFHLLISVVLLLVQCMYVFNLIRISFSCVIILN